jgi:hypothetical protein
MTMQCNWLICFVISFVTILGAWEIFMLYAGVQLSIFV